MLGHVDTGGPRRMYSSDLRKGRQGLDAARGREEGEVFDHPWRDKFCVKTDEGAPNGRISASTRASAPRRLVEIVPERKDATLTSFNIVSDMLSLDYTKDVQTKLSCTRSTGSS